MKKEIIFLVLAVLFFSSCATILGGPITDCQRKKPSQGEHPRKVRVGTLAAEASFFCLPCIVIDFSTGAIYQPCNKKPSNFPGQHKETNNESEQANHQLVRTFDTVHYKKHILKTSPISYFLEPTVFYDHHLGKGVYVSAKLGYKLGKENSQSDQDHEKGNLFQYYSGPVVGFGLRFPTSWNALNTYNGINNRMKFLEVELIYKRMSVNKVNLATAGIGGELRDYERLGGVTDGLTLKLLLVKQVWHKHLLFELFGGVGLKWRMNGELYKIGYGDSDGNGYITYTGYKDYEDFKQHNDPNFYQASFVDDQMFPTVHLGFNVGLGW